ncbi:hypothetical protein PQX77_003500 [Marasmius sp. AFHP31]|nr:hypothetical protein PQX77_003500 [Marasmius sp. AFHP31]
MQHQQVTTITEPSSSDEKKLVETKKKSRSQKITRIIGPSSSDKEKPVETIKKSRSQGIPRLRSVCGRHCAFAFAFNVEELVKLNTRAYEPNIPDHEIACRTWNRLSHSAKQIWHPSKSAILREIGGSSRSEVLGIMLAHNETSDTLRRPSSEIIEEIKTKLGIEKNPQWYLVEVV